jgi:uncharacterized protein YndB with AHSA1/START domain
VAEVRIEDAVLINAPTDQIWTAIKDPATHAAWHPFVTSISGEHRLGATRSCSVVIGGQTGHTTERCVEDIDEDTIVWAIEEDSSGFGRMVSSWLSGFRLERRDGATLVTAESMFRPKNVGLRLMTPIVRRKFHKTQQRILTALKTSIEAREDRACSHADAITSARQGRRRSFDRRS